ncbi:hypothetical protein OXPF_21500 [Oxobacter pfennigii]|uniref:YicC-like family, N-terminal region n=1 Tax=Oxobacter pfennigii TaxID=36849 RepID=A0A0P8WN62_9CLOT|nr:YicC/YloC family endoribonuclease [Oxobacter pfennigii]KPU43985.1 hypothetical protein OXPF_21500 [Oxobacter pfennigii]
MLKSMTGFGRGEHEELGRSFTVEIKTVNHRYTDVSIKMPRQLSYLEDKIRKYVLGSISRGKIDVFITQDKYSEEDINIVLDDVLASSYIKALHTLRDKFELTDDISVSMVARFPDIINVTKAEEDKEQIWNTLFAAIESSMGNLMEMRTAEGEKLSQDISTRGKYIKSVVSKIEERSPVVVQEYKIKLEDRIKEVAKDVTADENRVAFEVALFADRCSIAEEVVRLYSHIDQLEDIIKQKEPVGRKLDFLVQEMNREINTIGSKANDVTIARYVVDVKSEIEKIREQIQNIE